MNIKQYGLSMLFVALFSLTCTGEDHAAQASIIVSRMSLEQKIGQMIMFAVPGAQMSSETRKLIREHRPGGIILFGYNISGPKGLRDFIARMQHASRESGSLPLFLSIDQEGGRVKRIENGVTQFPGAMASGVADDGELLFQSARILGIQLRELGVNMNLAPDLDVNNNPDNPIINTRSFGSDPGVVSRMGVRYLEGLQAARCIAIGKHFPGHGDTSEDSHLTLPAIDYDLARLDKMEFVPFKAAVRADVEGIMTAHIAYPRVLGNREPATLSKKFLTDILRKEFKFKGLIMTDAMEMNAISKNYDLGEASVRTILAGTDIVLFISWGPVLSRAVKKIAKAVRDGVIPMVRIDESAKRIVASKLKYGIMKIKDKEIVFPEYKISDEEKTLLARAESVNRGISRKAVSFVGDPRLFDRGNRSQRVLIAYNDHVIKEAAKGGGVLCFRGIDARVYDAIKKRKGLGCTVFYYFHDNQDAVAGMKRFCRDNGADLVAVCSGNPFPVVKSGIAESMLFSFSNTAESLRQLGACIGGAFTPRMKCNLDLGGRP